MSSIHYNGAPIPGQAFYSYVYNTSGIADGNTYTSFADLAAELQRVPGEKVVYFRQDETLPAGTYDLRDVTFAGDGTQGNILVTLADGFVVSDWTNGKIDKGLAVESVSNSPIHSVSGSLTFVLNQGAVLGSRNASVFFLEDSCTFFAVGIQQGGYLLNSAQFDMTCGYEPVEVEDGFAGSCVAAMGLVTPRLDDDTFRSSAATLIRIIQTVGFNVDDGDVQTNMGGGVFDLYQTYSEPIFYDNTTSGLTASNVQAAIDELKTTYHP